MLGIASVGWLRWIVFSLHTQGLRTDAVVFTPSEVIYYAVMWSLAFLAGSCRTIRDRDYVNVWDCVAVGGVGGFYGFSVVCILSYYGPNVADFGWGYLGVATAIGTLGKEQDKITRAIFAGLFSRVSGANMTNKSEDDMDAKQ